MKETINKIVELASRYAEFGRNVGLPMTHNHIRGGHSNRPDWWTDGELINIYLADGGVWSVEFGRVEVKGYTGRISIPFDFTEEMLEATLKDALQYLDSVIVDEENQRQLQILELKSKLERLER